MKKLKIQKCSRKLPESVRHIFRQVGYADTLEHLMFFIAMNKGSIPKVDESTRIGESPLVALNSLCWLNWSLKVSVHMLQLNSTDHVVKLVALYQSKLEPFLEKTEFDYDDLQVLWNDCSHAEYILEEVLVVHPHAYRTFGWLQYFRDGPFHLRDIAFLYAQNIVVQDSTQGRSK